MEMTRRGNFRRRLVAALVLVSVSVVASAVVKVTDASATAEAIPAPSGPTEIGPSGLLRDGASWRLEWFLSGAEVCSHIALTTADGQGKAGECGPPDGFTIAVIDSLPANQSIIYGLIDQAVSDIEVCVLNGFPSNGICVTVPVLATLEPVRSFAAVAPASTPPVEDSIPGDEGQEPRVPGALCVLVDFNTTCVPIPEEVRDASAKKANRRRVSRVRGLPVRVTAHDSRGRVVGRERIPVARRERVPRRLTRRQKAARSRCLRRARLRRSRTGRRLARHRCADRYAPSHAH
jgi:hypothetical protein